ncbi:hypothetical protein BS78_04G115100 [Paspalum vaginatum]|nr:hypothetical protein BS78_04G115100 [Paspalum vaginatum]
MYEVERDVVPGCHVALLGSEGTAHNVLYEDIHGDTYPVEGWPAALSSIGASVGDSLVFKFLGYRVASFSLLVSSTPSSALEPPRCLPAAPAPAVKFYAASGITLDEPMLEFVDEMCRVSAPTLPLYLCKLRGMEIEAGVLEFEEDYCHDYLVGLINRRPLQTTVVGGCCSQNLVVSKR